MPAARTNAKPRTGPQTGPKTGTRTGLSRLIVGIDPSLGCTGWAVLEHDGSLLGRMVEGGTIKPSDGTLAERAGQIADEVAQLLQPLDLARVVLEFPAKTKRPPSWTAGERSILTLPNYGLCVGAVFQAIRWTCQDLLVTVAADEWTGGDIPSSDGDEHKTKRVEYVTQLYNLKPGSLGAKTYAGNVADAVLLARWGLFREKP
jgi:hypothetical protein